MRALGTNNDSDYSLKDPIQLGWLAFGSGLSPGDKTELCLLQACLPHKSCTPVFMPRYRFLALDRLQ